jgi:hypothetical protein
MKLNRGRYLLKNVVNILPGTLVEFYFYIWKSSGILPGFGIDSLNRRRFQFIVIQLQQG